MGKGSTLLFLLLFVEFFLLLLLLVLGFILNFFFSPLPVFFDKVSISFDCIHIGIFSNFVGRVEGRKKKGSGVVGVDRLRRSPVDAVIDLCRDVKEKGTHTHTYRQTISKCGGGKGRERESGWNSISWVRDERGR